MNPVADLELLVRSRYPLIAVQTWEEDRLASALQYVGARLKLHVYEWTIGGAIRRRGMVGGPVQEGAQTPLEALRSATSLGDGIFHMKDLHRFLGEPPVVRRLLELAPDFERDRRSIVISAPHVTLPAELEKRSAFVRFALPSVEELRATVTRVVADLRRDHRIKVELEPGEIEQLVERLRGMTIFEAERALTRAILRDLALTRDDLTAIVEMKRELLAKDGLLDYLPADTSLAAVGGFANLKAWLAKRRRAFTPEAKAFGIAAPKGLLLCGVQGCGKTLAAKAVAQDWGLPLLKLEPGRLYDKFIGESEKNLDKVLALAEGMAPCVLMIDEIEKGFASASSSESDAGLSRRLFGRLLGWLQDRRAPVFVVATSNRIADLPPELIRKGRFDEIFFIDLPTRDERKEIFAIHLARRDRDPARFDLGALADAAGGFSGAEIEQALVSALYTAFCAESDVTTAIVLAELQRRGRCP
jgi:SpoVK/Ycf46/Vps4 family AAA+-type ATPase